MNKPDIAWRTKANHDIDIDSDDDDDVLLDSDDEGEYGKVFT